MQCSYCAVAAAMLMSAAAVIAGGNGARHADFKYSPTTYLRGTPNGCSCESYCSSPVPCESAWDSGGNRCGNPCAACRNALSPLLPALAESLDCVIQRLYYNPCNIPCVRQRCQPGGCMDIWFGYRSDCGCNSCGAESWPLTAPTYPETPTPSEIPMPTNPFMDDELQAPPAVPKDLGYKGTTRKLQPVQHRQPKYSSEPTVVAPVKVAEVAKTVPAAEPTKASKPRLTRPVQQVKHETPATRQVPKNPLRGE